MYKLVTSFDYYPFCVEIIINNINHLYSNIYSHYMQT